ncbi:uncharacterized protein LOC111280604 [Durio zibethinus]|uniref:Uncharacterized protein LOC111280604 n=1 Tax=Durio zibethinus TaxID=66656 RepID=A0A6P5X831_DURZI|nr:uncharacterized protein LOC111280604 [Durio zibethinus]
MENPRERRQALGCKRAHFSLKPNLSQPTVCLDPSLDKDILKDQLFTVRLYFYIDAKREIGKQTGAGLMDLVQNVQSVAARPCRPGILKFDEWRSVKYKHHYSTAMSPFNSFEKKILSPLCGSKQEKSYQNVELHEKELASESRKAITYAICSLGLVTNAKNKVYELLDDLLSSNYDGDEAASLLQECLQIKSIDLEKVFLSDLKDIWRIDLRASSENSDVVSDLFSTDDIDRSPLRNASAIDSISKQSNQAESSADHLSSIPPRNPLASMSLQKKQMLHSDPQTDHFSIDNIDQAPGKNASSIESINKQSSQVDIEKEQNISHLLRSPLLESNQTKAANASSKLDGRDFAGLLDKFVNDKVRRFDSGINIVSSGSQADLENNSLSRPEIYIDSYTVKPNEFGGRADDIPVEVAVSVQTKLHVKGPTVDNSYTIQRETVVA